MGKLSFINKSAHYYIILLIVGFLFIGTVPKLIGLSESSLSIPYRGFIMFLSIFFIINTFLSKKAITISLRPILFFILFWIIYSIRILLDLFFDPIVLFSDTTASQYFQVAFGVTLIPSIAVFLIIQVYDIKIEWLLKWIYRILLVTLLIALYYRSGSEVSGRNAGDLNVGILIFGQYGATLSILSFFLLSNGDRNLKSKIFHIFGFVTGFIGIFVSASKSPFLALIVVLIIFLVFWYRSFKSAVIVGVVGAILSFYFLDIISFFSNYFNSNFLDRLLYAIEVGGDKARSNLATTAFDEFMDNPLFGNAMLIQKEGMAGSYPHNIIVEALMSTGAFGSAFFLLWLWKCFKGAINIIMIHSNITWIALVFLQYLIFSMFSKNLYSNDSFWLFTVLLIGAMSRVQLNKSLKTENLKT